MNLRQRYTVKPPNSRHLSITDKFFKIRSCPLFRGFTVFQISEKEKDRLSIYYPRGNHWNHSPKIGVPELIKKR